MTLLIQNISYLVVNSGTVLKDVDLLVENGRIASFGRDLHVPEDAEIVDGSGQAIMPGFVNAHTHLWQMAIKGRRDDLPLGEWCDNILTPTINALYATEDPEIRERRSYLWTALGICDMLHSGVTAFVDMDLNYRQDGMFKAAEEAGIRGFFGIELADWFMNGSINSDALEVVRLLEAHPGQCVLTPSELNICTDDTLSFVAEAAKGHNVHVQIHVDETAAEAKQAIAQRGAPELLYLDNFGLLDNSFSAVHGIHLSKKEIELAAKRDITVVYNPKSNMKLGSGVCPVRELLDAGINVALATDGPASNDILDMFEEMRMGAMLQKVSAKDASVLLAKDVFDMATAGGAQMLNLDAGSLEAGRYADFIVIPLDKPNLISDGSDMISTIVYCAQSRDVKDVYIGGKPVLKDYCIVNFDEAALTAEFMEHMAAIQEVTNV